MEQLGFTLGAFFLYLAILPLCGLLIGAALYLVMPYLIGVVAGALVFGQILHIPHAWVPTLFIGAIWACLVAYARERLRALEPQHLAWHDGHARAALTVFGLGLPYLRKRRTLEEVARTCQAEA